ncbi:MAG: dipeptidase PepE [Rhodothermaceae bacterium]|nr:dipeptidase PepE [Rhodothermaceae bacterium]
MRLLLLSNSTTDQGYLVHAADWLRDFLGEEVQRVLFVPFAAVTFSFDDYATKVSEAFEPLGYAVDSIHQMPDTARAVREAQAIAVGGGNTFRLLSRLYRLGLLDLIRKRVRDGLPYMGWSAGANLACPTIRTTNDMPIIQPPSFDALDLIPFQINPHYTDAHPPGHKGETRADRLREFIELNPEMPVLGMPEGTALRVEDDHLDRLGAHALRLFQHGEDIREVADTDLSALLAAA